MPGRRHGFRHLPDGNLNDAVVGVAPELSDEFSFGFHVADSAGLFDCWQYRQQSIGDFCLNYCLLTALFTSCYRHALLFIELIMV